jgi:hypothetical protein
MFPLDGAFASRNPRSALVAGGGFFRAADPDGVIMARFAWANPETGLASSERVTANDLLGFVQPVPGYWRMMVREGRYIRPGLPVTLFAGGDFWARFADGALMGQRVYASILDGAVISGEAYDAEPTPWFVVTNAAPGELAVISTWSVPQ